jgi:hypothetical protein
MMSSSIPHSEESNSDGNVERDTRWCGAERGEAKCSAGINARGAVAELTYRLLITDWSESWLRSSFWLVREQLLDWCVYFAGFSLLRVGLEGRPSARSVSRSVGREWNVVLSRSRRSAACQIPDPARR